LVFDHVWDLGRDFKFHAAEVLELEPEHLQLVLEPLLLWGQLSCVDHLLLSDFAVLFDQCPDLNVADDQALL
jgi:hypothetical protein